MAHSKKYCTHGVPGTSFCNWIAVAMRKSQNLYSHVFHTASLHTFIETSGATFYSSQTLEGYFDFTLRQHVQKFINEVVKLKIFSISFS
jgi:hypothetical protein